MDALGINVINILIYSLVFLVLYIILNKFLFNKILNFLEKRKQDIQDTIKLKKNLQEKHENLENQTKIIKSKAQKQAEKQATQIISTAKKEKQEILKTAKLESEQIIQKANQRLELEKEKQEKQFQKQIEKKVNEKIKQIYKEYKIEIDKAYVEKLLNE